MEISSKCSSCYFGGEGSIEDPSSWSLDEEPRVSRVTLNYKGEARKPRGTLAATQVPCMLRSQFQGWMIYVPPIRLTISMFTREEQRWLVHLEALRAR